MTHAQPKPLRYVVAPKTRGNRRRYHPSQIAAVKHALKHARYVQMLADGEAHRIAEESGVALEMVRGILKGERGKYVELIDDEAPAPTTDTTPPPTATT